MGSNPESIFHRLGYNKSLWYLSGKKAPSVAIINTAVDIDIELDAIRLLILLLSINLDQITLVNHVNKYN
jgi:hypothetical protein